LGVPTCAVSPVGKDRRYADLDAGLLPKTESLADTVERFLPYWHDTIAPAIKSGKRVIVAAHGNRFALPSGALSCVCVCVCVCCVCCVCARQSSFCRFDRRSLRALVKYLDNVPESEITELNIPTAIPLVYELDADLKPIKHYYLADEVSGTLTSISFFFFSFAFLFAQLFSQFHPFFCAGNCAQCHRWCGCPGQGQVST
jgi:hypothetical protein